MKTNSIGTHDPAFAKEKELEDWIAGLIGEIVSEAGYEHIILRHFGLDIAVFISSRSATIQRFLEVKACAPHHGRCGFGNQRGEGNQIRLLFDATRGEERTPEALSSFDTCVRWILGSTEKPVGSPRYALFTCRQAQAAAMNGVRPGKQNNLRISAFDRSWITWTDLAGQLEIFLLGGLRTREANDLTLA